MAAATLTYTAETLKLHALEGARVPLEVLTMRTQRAMVCQAEACYAMNSTSAAGAMSGCCMWPGMDTFATGCTPDAGAARNATTDARVAQEEPVGWFRK
jgi:hypothetical protein